jgi:RHS repeat-associated protein
MITYDYDGLQRLITAVETGATTNSYAYTYDNAGNRLTASCTGGPACPPNTTHTYNAANQVDGWTYDNAGNLLNDGTTAYQYDALNRLTARSGITFSYNGDGTLVSQLTGGTTTRYSQDLAGPLSQILSDGTSTSVYGMDRLYGEVGIIKSWYTTDALGSVRAISSNAGIASATASYDPYGQLQSGSVGSFGFTGELQQGSSVYLRARWYNAAAGSFGVRDPFAGVNETPYSLHYYQYGYANPVSNTDPSGRCISWIIDAVAYALNKEIKYKCAYGGWESVPGNLWELVDYGAGLAGVPRDASGQYDVADFALSHLPLTAVTYRLSKGAYQAAEVASNPSARAAVWQALQSGVDPKNWPGMFWDGLKQPWEEFACGFASDDNYLLGSGTRGIGEQIVTGAGIVDSIKLLRAAIAAKMNPPPSRVYRVQGGTLPRASRVRIHIGAQGEMKVVGNEMLFVTFDDIGRVKAYVANNRPGAEIISFEVDPAFVTRVRKAAVPQLQGTNYPNAPQIADPTKTSSSFGLPANWIKELQQAARIGSGRRER